jgi:hypothetical protein
MTTLQDSITSIEVATCDRTNAASLRMLHELNTIWQRCSMRWYGVICALAEAEGPFVACTTANFCWHCCREPQTAAALMHDLDTQ